MTLDNKTLEKWYKEGQQRLQGNIGLKYISLFKIRRNIRTGYSYIYANVYFQTGRDKLVVWGREMKTLRMYSWTFTQPKNKSLSWTVQGHSFCLNKREKRLWVWMWECSTWWLMLMAHWMVWHLETVSNAVPLVYWGKKLSQPVTCQAISFCQGYMLNVCKIEVWSFHSHLETGCSRH